MRQVQLEDLGIIRFISTPKGSAPIEIREKWIGIEVPCLFSHDGVKLEGGRNYDVNGFEIPDFPGFVVLQTHALVALIEKSLEAAHYWAGLGFPEHPLALFLFDIECAEVLKLPMTRKEFHERFSDA